MGINAAWAAAPLAQKAMFLFGVADIPAIQHDTFG
jgi:hypothetical protein